jgi:hypothetical protein
MIDHFDKDTRRAPFAKKSKREPVSYDVFVYVLAIYDEAGWEAL